MDLLHSLVRPSEAVALVQFKSKYGSTKRGGAGSAQLDENLQYCYDNLFKTSRSFAMVIADLGDELRDAVCGMASICVLIGILHVSSTR
jgi:hypothetical protein